MPIQRVNFSSRHNITKSENEPKMKEVPPEQIIRPNGRVSIIALVVIIALVGLTAAWLFKKNLDMKKELAAIEAVNNQAEIAKEEINNLLEKVRKLIVLPTDETPTVATITDANALKAEQQFYRDAKDGDKVIIYMQSKKAFIYDEDRNILVNVGPIFINDNSTTTPPVSVEDAD